MATKLLKRAKSATAGASIPAIAWTHAATLSRASSSRNLSVQRVPAVTTARYDKKQQLQPQIVFNMEFTLIKIIHVVAAEGHNVPRVKQ